MRFHSHNPCRRLQPASVALVAVTLIGGAAQASADTLYSYTGNVYTVKAGTYAVPQALSLAGSLDLTLSLPQLENLSDFTVPSADIASASFSDTLGTSFTENTAAFSLFQISTDASARITSWKIYLSSAVPLANSTVVGVVLLTEAPPVGPVAADLSGTSVSTTCGNVANPPVGCSSSLNDGGAQIGVAGLWSPPTQSAVPEPSSIFLLGAGALACVRRFRRG